MENIVLSSWVSYGKSLSRKQIRPPVFLRITGVMMYVWVREDGLVKWEIIDHLDLLATGVTRSVERAKKNADRKAKMLGYKLVPDKFNVMK